MIISIDTEKAFSKTQYSFTIKKEKHLKNKKKKENIQHTWNRRKLSQYNKSYV